MDIGFQPLLISGAVKPPKHTIQIAFEDKRLTKTQNTYEML